MSYLKNDEEPALLERVTVLWHAFAADDLDVLVLDHVTDRRRLRRYPSRIQTPERQIKDGCFCGTFRSCRGYDHAHNWYN